MSTGYVILILFTLCLVESHPLFPFKRNVKRHTADMKIAQYMACLSVRSVKDKDCRNIGWGLVDIFESGRKKRTETPVEIILPIENDYESFNLDDTDLN